ncbi:tldc domain-containing protein [Stylonychia lemnae]|uniref:Tldc domain-containing protein n=1 Tax=Stylonychia lemnae TaxID=5949 RepID=A0A078A032_STYLE|nr:tldc domain-containing protein [Stylonychia lemnae]|eukprot:CDW75500.1 tldc domain-containing protein [Stylonychia lemnae]
MMKQNGNEILNCPCCNKVYNLEDRRPLILPCEDEICSQCYNNQKDQVQNQQIQCPFDSSHLCGVDEPVKEFKYMIRRLHNQINCGEHQGNHVQFYCKKQNNLICAYCFVSDSHSQCQFEGIIHLAFERKFLDESFGKIVPALQDQKNQLEDQIRNIISFVDKNRIFIANPTINEDMKHAPVLGQEKEEQINLSEHQKIVSDLQNQLREATALLETKTEEYETKLETQQKENIEKIQSLNKEYQDKLNSQQQDYEAKIDNKQKEIKLKLDSQSKEFQAKLISVSKENQVKLDKQKQETQVELNSQTQEYQTKLDSQSKQYKAQLDTLLKENQNKLKTMANEYKSKEDSLKEEFQVQLKSQSEEYEARLDSMSQEHQAQLDQQSKENKAKQASLSKENKHQLDNQQKEFQENFKIKYKNFQEKSLLGLIPEQRFMNFRRLVDNTVDINNKKKLFKLPGKCKLLYRASRDGFKAANFHQLCDNQGPTVCFIESEHKEIFGGYTSVPWTSESKYIKDSRAFVFSLSKNTIHQQYQKQDNAVVHYKDWLMVFGWGYDICIRDDCNINNSSYCSLGGTYNPEQGLKYKDEEANDYLAGKNQFKVVEIEVFSVALD